MDAKEHLKFTIFIQINTALNYMPPSNKRRTQIMKNLINATVFIQVNTVSLY